MIIEEAPLTVGVHKQSVGCLIRYRDQPGLVFAKVGSSAKHNKDIQNERFEK